MDSKEEYLKIIESNIIKYGYHIYGIFDSGPLPRFFYTIGLTGEIGSELIFAGAFLYSDEEVKDIIDEIIIKLKEDTNINRSTTTLGEFSLEAVDPTWSEKLMLGVLDYYNVSKINSLQIIPTDDYYLTIDVPKFVNKYDPALEPVWKWLTMEWDFPIPKNSMCAADLDALHGKSIVQAIRWEEDYWEVYSKPSSEVLQEDARFVFLGIFLAVDFSNEIFAQLSVNEAASRIDADHDWELWGVKEG